MNKTQPLEFLHHSSPAIRCGGKYADNIWFDVDVRSFREKGFEKYHGWWNDELYEIYNGIDILQRIKRQWVCQLCDGALMNKSTTALQAFDAVLPGESRKRKLPPQARSAIQGLAIDCEGLLIRLWLRVVGWFCTSTRNSFKGKQI